MPKMKYWDDAAQQWITLDANDATTLQGLSPSDFASAPVYSETEPTENLYDGMMWFDPNTQQIKMYIDGSFRGLGGGSLQVDRSNTTLAIDSSVVSINIVSYNKDHDKLIVFANSVYLNEGIDYNVSPDSLTIIHPDSFWDAGTEFTFLVFASVDLNPDVISVSCLTSSFIADQDNTTNVPINQPYFDKDTDELQVYYKNLILHDGENYSLNIDGQSIDLIDFSIGTGEKIVFYVWKKYRTQMPAARHVLIGTQEWTATEGQTVFNVTNGEYPSGKRALFVTVDGALQPFTSYVENSNIQFTLVEGVPAGTKVFAYWFASFDGELVGTLQHGNTHAPGGTDGLEAYYATKSELNEKADQADVAALEGDVTALESEVATHLADYASPHLYEDEGTDPDWAGVKYRIVVINGLQHLEVVES